ncbi:polysialic acid transport ATP-binding protein [Candidatus Scalindua japonica]|uniref:Polysialic acid transport ATP-binding protein n=1 Tax=Candidatus Scalindua japonica TaxID=1284222 RepID=A0A286U4A9_9BACT|nr:ABC transporter ATP-binding protein [Candidatus Scalindua japonica]GAX62967.1 polysialic acid transport ATP-binding protein [Candidatus Scalindua japonica]
MNDSEVLIKVENVSKKFCRKLKRSLWYGMKDLGSELIGRSNSHRDLRKDEFWALDDVSFELKRGECLGLIGPNGSGKSTLLKMLNGLIKPDKGKITMRGRVGALIELGAGFNPILTGKENIYINGSVLGFTEEEISNKFESILEFAEIGKFIDTPVQNYSSGMKVRLGFAVAAHMEPDILIIDEVLAVGDIGFRIKCMNAIDRISRNASIVFVSHSMPAVSRICSRVVVLNLSNIVFQGYNVSKGIEQYYSIFQRSKTQILGRGKTSIHEIKLYSDNKKESDNSIFKINYLDNLYIEMSFSVHLEIKRCLINIAFLNQEMIPVAQCYSINSDLEIVNNGEILRFQIKFPKFQLNPGIYSIDVSIVEELENGKIGEILSRYESIKNFQIVGDVVGWASIQFQGEWTII